MTVLLGRLLCCLQSLHVERQENIQAYIHTYGPFIIPRLACCWMSTGSWRRIPHRRGTKGSRSALGPQNPLPERQQRPWSRPYEEALSVAHMKSYIRFLRIPPHAGAPWRRWVMGDFLEIRRRISCVAWMILRMASEKLWSALKSCRLRKRCRSMRCSKWAADCVFILCVYFFVLLTLNI